VKRRCSVRGLRKRKAEAIKDEEREGEMDGWRPIIKCLATTPSIYSRGKTKWEEVKNGTCPQVFKCISLLQCSVG
jgi:hypothetical protein